MLRARRVGGHSAAKFEQEAAKAKKAEETTTEPQAAEDVDEKQEEQEAIIVEEKDVEILCEKIEARLFEKYNHSDVKRYTEQSRSILFIT